MNKSCIFASMVTFGLGTITGNQLCRNNIKRMSKNEKLAINIPSSKDDMKERVPKAVSAAAKELVDQRTIDITTGETK